MEAWGESSSNATTSPPSGAAGAASTSSGNPATGDGSTAAPRTGATSTSHDGATIPTTTPNDKTTSYPYDYDYDYYNYDYYDYDYDMHDYYYGGIQEETKEEEYEIEEAIRAELALQNDSTVVGMGHQFEDLVFECSYRGYDCRYFELNYFDFF